MAITFASSLVATGNYSTAFSGTVITCEDATPSGKYPRVKVTVPGSDDEHILLAFHLPAELIVSNGDGTSTIHEERFLNWSVQRTQLNGGVKNAKTGYVDVDVVCLKPAEKTAKKK